MNINLIYFILLIIITKSLNLKKNKLIKLAIYKLPVKKKSVIFLRAPYKNKLARLNVVRIERTIIIAVKTHNSISLKNMHNFSKLYKFINIFKKHNISTPFLKNVKTKLYFNVNYSNNYKYNNFI